VPPGPSPLSASLLANDVWGVDFKGWFRTGDGQRCDPLSLSDLATRYVLRLQAVERCDGEHVWPLFDAAFREFGLPRVMRSDNGPPFAGTGVGGLSALAVRLIKAGVLPERIAPGKPQQNGRHERMHLTLLQEVANPPANSLREQHKRLRDFRRSYNEERPHQALDNATPAERYQASPRRFDGVPREPDYDDDRMVRRVRHNGEIKLNGNMIYISAALIGEPIGLAEDQQGWSHLVRECLLAFTPWSTAGLCGPASRRPLIKNVGVVVTPSAPASTRSLSMSGRYVCRSSACRKLPRSRPKNLA